MKTVHGLVNPRRSAALAALAALLVPSIAFAQRAPARPGRSVPIKVSLTPVHKQVQTIALPGEGGVAGSGCPPVINAHTNFDFVNGGSANLQGGFAEEEIAAVQFVLTPADFPFIIDSVEVIIAQNHFNPTTTQFTVLVWEGPPNTGLLAAEFSSDGKILQPIQLPTGNPPAQAVNMTFQVDPGDPEQIQINANPSNSYTVGFRIDEHNNQTQNPCFVAPPANSNAFPTTDLGGVASLSGNWLFGLNCGGLGCPPGWRTFAQLGLCQPSGDWVMRATRRPFVCAPPTGACCMPVGSCSVQTQQACTQSGGAYQGNGTVCGSCPTPQAPCCFPGGGCVNLTIATCLAASGVPGPVGSTCTGFTCFPTGACCLPSGQCQDRMSPDDCEEAGGVYQGNDTSCELVDCPPPTGGCCLSSGFCILLTQSDCSQIPNSTWAGAGTTCADGNASGTADVCESGSDADLDNDGDVDGVDLGILLVSWSQPPGSPGCDAAPNCPADIDGDKDVDGVDLGILLANWSK